MTQLLTHLLGDYILQSQWMAENKTKRWLPALLHAIVYSLPFLLLPPALNWQLPEWAQFHECSWTAFAVILGSHYLIDRYRLARCLVWFKNVALSPTAVFIFGDLEDADVDDQTLAAEIKERREQYARLDWDNCKATGYPADVPAWMAVWLLIAADNFLHLLINFLSLAML